MSYKILVTPRSFGKSDPKPFTLLKEKGYEVIVNPYPRIMTQEEMIKEIKDVDGVIIGVDPLNSEVLTRAANLRAISKYGVGLDNIDLELAKSRGIKVSKTIGANSEAVAEFAVTLMLATARRMPFIDQECRKRNWAKIKAIQMDHKTLGLIGLGNIGKCVTKKVSGYDMSVIAYDVVQDQEYAKRNGIEFVDLETLLKKSDFISIHLPLVEATKNLISYKEFEMMKEKAVLVNTARGGIINEEALLWALKNNKIWGAGIDVFEEEPPKNDEFLKLDNIIIGSHCAASTMEAIDNMGIMAAQNLINSLEDVHER
ncbi:MAG TPA: hydroxyacid dehydrogenase [Firmicutes bacterium]|nr:hydroxyacid dehydrogenase [Bacillota bacterium]